ncbi:MAG: DUF4860 domain-containing protein [Clostridia bacterium]|nr:DUF4860 domain-containing protein [Clostridia bacterium]
MKKSFQETSLAGVTALLLFCIFAACALAVLLTGADTYRSLTQRDADVSDRRTCIQYLSTKVRQADARSLSLEPFGDGDALVITQQLGETEYVTRIYVHDGWLTEQFCAVGADLAPGDGQPILPLKSLSVSREQDRLIFVTVDADGTQSRLIRTLRGSTLHSSGEERP